MDAAAHAVEEATGLAGQSGEALKHIVELVVGASDQVQSIATAAEEQSAASEEINRSLGEISRITLETSKGMGQSARDVVELAELAHKLQRLIEEMNQA
jgi:methyl-accepting chemotaxis protein